MKRATSPERRSVANAALRLRRLKHTERELRLGPHRCDTLESGQVLDTWNYLVWMRGAQKAVAQFQRKYASYRNRTLTKIEGAVSCALTPGVPGDLP